MAISVVASAQNLSAAEQNPLLQEFPGEYQAPPFDQIKVEHYKPAMETLIAKMRAEIDAIANNPEAPTFENTVLAVEYAGRDLSEVAAVFYALNSSATNEQMDAVAMELSPLLSELSTYVSLNEKIFERVKAVYDKKDELGLDAVDMRLLSDQYDGFIRGGAGLNDADKARYKEVSKELSALSLQFGQNVLGDTNDYILHITDEARIAELPMFVKQSLSGEAKSRDLEGWVVTLQAPSYVPFLIYSSDRDLKEQLWRAYGSRGYKDNKFNNEETVIKLANLRLELANIMGEKSYADYILADRMAQNAQNVAELLDELQDKTRDYAIEEFKTIEAYAKENGFDGEFMPWDWSYYSEKYKNEKYSISSEMIKPYLKLENVERGVFELAGRLYGLSFESVDVPVYDKDARAFKVLDKDGSYLALLYMDYFPRESKRGGAWMTSFRDMYTTLDGQEVRPFITVTTNFTKPTETTPALLTFGELETILHEFGHALHGILAEGKYPSMTGTSVYRDFVELPSQIMENWATEREFLDMFAVHYETGEKIPQELVDRIVAAQNYHAAYNNIRQVAYGLNDMGWHSITEPIKEGSNIAELEHKYMEGTQVFFPVSEGIAIAPAFTHIFSGGYAVGYYGYKWAEVLDADAFSLFKEKGIFDGDVASSFRNNILTKGGTEHPMDLYVKFRGRKPDTQALFERMGLGK
ncbi:MAG: M3 family metallopeptidase [Rikenellaceae bacterium]